MTTGKKPTTVSASSSPPPRQEASSLLSVARQFTDSLEQLRDFVGLIAPVLDEQMKKTVERRGKTLLPLLAVMARALPQAIKLAAEPAHVKRVLQKYRVDETGPGQFSVNVPDAESSEFGEAMVAVVKTLRHSHHLYNSSLVSLVSSAEIFVGNMLAWFYGSHPEAADLDSKPLTFKELSSFPDVAAAREYLIEKKIEHVIRGSLAEWLTHLRDRVNLSLGYLADEHSYLIEIFQRRNLLVHAGGFVNRIYLANVPEPARGGLTLGDAVVIDKKYLLPAIDRVELAFTLIAAELWKREDASDEKRAKYLVDTALEHLKGDRWAVAEGLSKFVVQDKKMPERLRVAAELNVWQAAKAQGRFDDVAAAVRAADYSAKSPDFVVARYALLDDAQSFFREAPKVVRSGHLSAQRLKTWPVFHGLRDKPEFAELVGVAESLKVAADRSLNSGAESHQPVLEPEKRERTPTVTQAPRGETQAATGSGESAPTEPPRKHSSRATHRRAPR